MFTAYQNSGIWNVIFYAQIWQTCLFLSKQDCDGKDLVQSCKLLAPFFLGIMSLLKAHVIIKIWVFLFLEELFFAELFPIFYFSLSCLCELDAPLWNTQRRKKCNYFAHKLIDKGNKRKSQELFLVKSCQCLVMPVCLSNLLSPVQSHF